MTREQETTRITITVELRPFRCPRCGTLLAKLRLTAGSVVEIKCSRCNAMAKDAA